MFGEFFKDIDIKSRKFTLLILGISVNWYLSLSFIFFGWENYIFERNTFHSFFNVLENYIPLNFFSEDILLISGIFGGFCIGCIVWGYIISRTSQSYSFMLLNIPQGIFIILLTFLSLDDFFLYIYLFILGILPAAGIVGGLVFFMKSTKIEVRGRTAGLITGMGVSFMCGLAIISIFVPLLWYFRIGGTIYLTIGLLTIFIKKFWGVSTEKPEQFFEYNRKDYLNYLIPIILLGSIGGLAIFFVLLEPILYRPLTKSITMIFFGSEVTYSLMSSLMETVVIIITISGAPMGILIGSLSDFYGRRWMWYFGLIMGSAGAFFFGFFQSVISVLSLFLCYGVVFSCISNYVLTTYSDLLFSAKRDAFYLGIVVGLGVGGGLFMGAGVGFFLIDISVVNFALTLMMLLLFGFGTIGQAHETLPPRKELEWYRTVKHLYIISDNGICMYECAFRKSETDSTLVTGGISGIMAMIQELTESKTRLKIIRQEGMNILLEYGPNISVCLLATEDLSILRTKMKNFADEFEDFFRNVIPNWDGNVDYFIPAEVLVERIFELKKFKKLNE